MKEIIIATKNKGKVKEFAALFEKLDIKLKSLIDLDEPMLDIEETGTTFKENARLKAEGIAEILQVPVIADDSGLEIDALNGAPGVFSARYAGEPTDDVRNYEKVLKEMLDVPELERTARFVCVLAFAIPGKETMYAKGTCEGKISFAPKGTNGFGYDPIFIPQGFKQTMAQLEQVVKNKISHRYHALEKLEKILRHNLTKGE